MTDAEDDVPEEIYDFVGFHMHLVGLVRGAKAVTNERKIVSLLSLACTLIMDDCKHGSADEFRATLMDRVGDMMAFPETVASVLHAYEKEVLGKASH